MPALFKLGDPVVVNDGQHALAVPPVFMVVDVKVPPPVQSDFQDWITLAWQDDHGVHEWCVPESVVEHY